MYPLILAIYVFLFWRFCVSENDHCLDFLSKVCQACFVANVHIPLETHTCRLLSDNADVANLNCWAATLPSPLLDARGIRIDETDPSLSVLNLTAIATSLHLNISCSEGGCTSPGFYDLAQTLNSEDAQADATDVANKLFTYISRLLGGSYLQVVIDRFLSDAARRCPHSDTYDVNATEARYEPFSTPTTTGDTQYLVILFACAAGLLSAVAALILLLRVFVNRRHRKWLASLSIEQQFRILSEQQKLQAMETEINETTTALFRSPEIPLFVRILMPLVILGNIGFFISGHLSVAASVVRASFKTSKFCVGCKQMLPHLTDSFFGVLLEY
jgi:hypothetical protein